MIKDFYQSEYSCDVNDSDDIVIIDQNLRLYTRNKKYLSRNYTGVTLISKVKFQNVVIRINVKRPLGKSITAAISLILTDNENEYGNVLGQVDIARFHTNKLTEFGIKYAPGLSHNHLFIDNFRDQDKMIRYWIKTDETLIEWPVNNKLIYQANRNMDSQGNNLHYDENISALPFDKPFYLMLHVGVESPNMYSEHQDELETESNWERPYMEISSIEVYPVGENSKVIRKKEKVVDQHERKINESSGSNITYIVIPLVVLLILISSMFVLAVIKMKKLKTAQANFEITSAEEMYADNIENDDKYEDVNLNEYETYIYDQVKEPEYLEII